MQCQPQALILFILAITSTLCAQQIPERLRERYPSQVANYLMAGPFTEKPMLRRVGVMEFGVLDFENHVFTTDAFPLLRLRNPSIVAELLGGILPQWEVRYLNNSGEAVVLAETPGRYGAEITAALPNGSKITFTRDLYRLPHGSTPEDASELTAMHLGAIEMMGRPLTEEDPDPGVFSDRWWHEIKRRQDRHTVYTYFVEMPESQSSDSASAALPVIIYLHGQNGWSKNHAEELRDDFAVQHLREKQKNRRFILVVPHSRQRWEGPAFGDFLDELKSHFPVDPKAVSIYGYSGGASGAWQIVRGNPRRIAAIVTLAGDPVEPEMLPALKGLNVLAYYGENDFPAPLRTTRIIVEALAKQGNNATFKLVPNLNHPNTPRRLFPLDELYDWMLQQRLEKTN